MTKRPRFNSLLDTSDNNCDLIALAAEAISAPARYPTCTLAHSPHIFPTSSCPSHPKPCCASTFSVKISVRKPIQPPQNNLPRLPPVECTNPCSAKGVFHDWPNAGGIGIAPLPEPPRRANKRCTGPATRNPVRSKILHSRRMMKAPQDPLSNLNLNSQWNPCQTQPLLPHRKRTSTPCQLQRERTPSCSIRHLVRGSRSLPNLHAKPPAELSTMPRDLVEVGRPPSSTSSLQQCMKDLEESPVAESTVPCCTEKKTSLDAGKSFRFRPIENKTARATALPQETSRSREQLKNIARSNSLGGQRRVTPEGKHVTSGKVMGRNGGPKVEHAEEGRRVKNDARARRRQIKVLPSSKVQGVHFDALIASGKIDKHLQRVERKLRKAEQKHNRRGR